MTMIKLSLVYSMLSCLFLRGMAENDDMEFYNACARGNVETVQQYLEDSPNLVTSATADGETCLHLTAISKSFEVAKLLVEKGADVNHRVTHSKGLRMMPLSWHAWGGNVEIIQLLLDNGANINDDFDFSSESNAKVTATDIAITIAAKDAGGDPKKNENNPDNFDLSYQLLVSRGGKLYEELFPESPHILSKEINKEDPRDGEEQEGQEL